ncbi:MAG: SHOCT domain-containing protein [Micromonosporaceae bacterium]
MFGTGWCGGMSGWGWLLMALLWGGFLAVVVWAVTWLFPRGRSRPSDQEDAAGLLDRRFASGDIDEDTYRRLRGELTATH